MSTHTPAAAQAATTTPGSAAATGLAAAKSAERSIDAFRDAHGLFTMVAVDQRESLRHLIAQGRAASQHTDQAGALEVSDAALVGFKTSVADALTDQASGFLVDRLYGLDAARQARCPVILAADVLSASVPGGPVDVAAIDDEVTLEVVQTSGAGALKLLVPWHPDRRQQAVDLSTTFMERCRRWEVPGVVEGVVRPREGALLDAKQFGAALVQAAEDLAATHPDLYKTEVIFASTSDRQLATDTAQAITEVTPCPWVVLSSGVPTSMFGSAVEAAIAGGASGFLAGRAVWGGSVGVADVDGHLRSVARRNFTELVHHVWSL